MKQRLLFSILAAIALAPLAHAKIKLPALVSDHMVLQSGARVNIWGWAAPGEKVTVAFSGKTASAQAGADGKWSARLAGLAAGASGDLTISGEDEKVIKDVLVGEVWVASGQSNMEMIVANSKDFEKEKAAADFPQVRMFILTKAASLTPKDDCEGAWFVATPENVGKFSAVGYFFARELHQQGKMPVGVIHTSWGGTPAEYWTPPAVIERELPFKGYGERWEADKKGYPAAKAAYDEARAKWVTASEQAKADGKPMPPPPRPPRGDGAIGAPGCLFNGMIEPVLPYTIQGAIWYQGESNANSEEDAKLYRALFPTMILSWRHAWSQAGRDGADNPEFPFLFVQLANYRARRTEPVDSLWAVLRESQFATLEIPRTGMAVAIDIGEALDIHPKNKQEVGRRLALSALAQVYYHDIEYSGPLFSGAQEEDGKMRLSFRNADGLKAVGGGRIKGFALAGEDRKFVWADVEIDADHVLVSSRQVPKPVAVRYGWDDNPEANLINGAGLPASPFRTDDWPQKPPPPVAR
ncbi:MAG: sialate O-acetylesterase [Chthoniobacteraceae bacterium]